MNNTPIVIRQRPEVEMYNARTTVSEVNTKTPFFGNNVDSGGFINWRNEFMIYGKNANGEWGFTAIDTDSAHTAGLDKLNFRSYRQGVGQLRHFSFTPALNNVVDKGHACLEEAGIAREQKMLGETKYAANLLLPNDMKYSSKEVIEPIRQTESRPRGPGANPNDHLHTLQRSPSRSVIYQGAKDAYHSITETAATKLDLVRQATLKKLNIDSGKKEKAPENSPSKSRNSM